MTMTALSHDIAANPLDIMEQIITANDWAVDRRSDSEMAAEAPGRWCDYGLWFSWSHEISAMHFTCAFDLKVPEKRRAALYELLALANERLWIGHFGMESEEGIPVFRHAVLLRGAPGASAESLEDMVDIAITECERFFPAFQFVLWGGKTPQDALQAAMLECVGEHDGRIRAGHEEWGSGVRPRARMSIPPILLVGCGRMGSAMLSGWREQGLASSVAVDPAAAAAEWAGADLTVAPDVGAVPEAFAPAAVVFAVKPQNAAETLPLYRQYAGKAVFLSIMAGRTIAGMQALLGGEAAIVRAMPNTPAAVRQGVTVACPGLGVEMPQRALCERLLQAIGVVAWVEDEALLDPVTAVSGSGPAYVFLLAELMEQAARRAGNSRRPCAVARATDGVRVRRVAGGERRGRRSVAHRGHQSRRHHRARARRTNGQRCLAGGVEQGDRGGDGAFARVGRIGEVLRPPRPAMHGPPNTWARSSTGRRNDGVATLMQGECPYPVSAGLPPATKQRGLDSRYC